MNWSELFEANDILEAGAMIVLMYSPPDRTVCRVTRTIDLKAHARAFQRAYRARLAAGEPDRHQGHVGDAWAAELLLSGILDPFCDSQEPCEAHADWLRDEHDYDYTLCIYPQGAKLGGKDTQY
jgi:hypothetical protein